MSCTFPEVYANPRDLGQVAAPLKDLLWTMMRHSPRGGLVLISGKRTDFQQKLLRSPDRGIPRGQECNPAYKGHPTTAVPGRSRHRNLGYVGGTDDANLIAAADMGGIDLDWAGAHEADFGLNRPVPGEKWHFQKHGNAKVPVIPYGQDAPAGTTPIPVDPNKGRHWIGFKPGDFDGVKGSIYKRGGFDNEVAELQIRLRVLSSEQKNPKLHPGTVDGIYGKKSQDAVLEFHRSTRETQLFINAVRKQKGDHSRVEVWPEPDPNVGIKKISLLRFWTA